ncbi:MAG: ATP synthase F1 subunit gamma [Chloroflexi bacterium]|nr:ATP synthase F1 subunit gamma [Chloroflexota bacterium]
MASAREMRLRMRSVKNISQVTRALEAVSASKVRKAQQAVMATRAYAGKAYDILTDLSNQPGSLAMLHPLLTARETVKTIEIVLVTSDRGLAGAYNSNIVRETMAFARAQSAAVRYVTVGRKGRDLVFRRRGQIVAEFGNLPTTPTTLDIAPIARTAIDDFLNGAVDEVYLAYTDFVNTIKLIPTVKKLLPFSTTGMTRAGLAGVGHTDGPIGPRVPFIYEPNAQELLNTILPRFTQLQILQAVLEAGASEHSARMVAMRNATDNAEELVSTLQLQYNKARQLAITSDLLDIAGGAEALAKATQK